jgi:hypothetical protein
MNSGTGGKKYLLLGTGLQWFLVELSQNSFHEEDACFGGIGMPGCYSYSGAAADEIAENPYPEN